MNVKSRLAAFVCGLVVSSVVAAAIPTSLRYVFQRTPSGRIDHRYQDGVDPTPAIPLAWAAITPINVQTTATGSVNLCTTYLTQPAAPGNVADLTVESGYTLPTGFSLGSTHNCVLSWATPSATNTIVRIRATLSGQTPATSGDLQIIVTAPPGTDTTAPPIPLGLTAASSTGTVTLSWDAVCDNYVSAVPAGTTTYDVRLASTVVNSPAQSNCTTGQLTTYNIGTIASPGAPSITQSGNDFDLTAAGTGIQGTADQLVFRGIQVNTGSGVTQSVKVTSFTVGALNFGKEGLWIRGSIDPDAISYSCGVQKLADGTVQVQVRGRSAVAGTAGSLATVTVAAGLPLYVRQRLDASGMDCEYSLDGNAFTAVITDRAVSFPSSPFFGIGLTSNNAGSNSSGELDNYNLSSLTRRSYAHTTSTGGSYTVRAKDAAGSPNASAYSAAVVATPSTPPSAPAIKFHPGHYVTLDGNIRAENRAATMSAHQAVINEICNLPEWQGVKIFPQWSSLETGNDPNAATRYDAGIAMIAQYLAWLQPCNKSLMMGVHIQQFGGYAPGAGLVAYFPQYLLSSPYGTTVMANGITTRVWQPATADRLILMLRTYAAQFNTHPNFEIISTNETALGVATGTDGFSLDALATQIKRIVDAAVVDWNRTGVRVSTNYMSPDALFIDLITYLAARRVIMGGPDVIPTEQIQANQLYKGLRRTQGTPLGAWGSATAGTDLRGQLIWLSEVQSPSLCGHEGCFTPGTLFTFVRTGENMWPVYMAWYRNMFQPDDEEGEANYRADWYEYRWSAIGHATSGIKWYIGTQSGQITSGSSGTLISPASVPCPPAYTNGCDRDYVQ